MSEAEESPEILSTRNVSLGFVDVPRKRRRLLGFIDLPQKGEGEPDWDWEEVKMCWLEGSRELRDRLQRLGIEPREEYKHDREFSEPVDMYSSVAAELVTVATGVLPSALSGALGVWFQARFGRKIRLKIGDMEAEATSVAEIELLLERAKAHTQPEGEAAP